MLRFINAVGCLLFCLLSLAGCGESELQTYPASGKVIFADGKPLTGGFVEFQPVDAAIHITARGQIQPDGTFELGTLRKNDGAVAGEYLVSVTPPMPSTDADTLSKRPLIDPRFRDPHASGFRFTVSSEASQNRFSLEVFPPRN